MRKPIVAGNWKMNGSLQFTTELLNFLKPNVAAFSAIEKLVFPPYTYLSRAQAILDKTTLGWGAQNLSAYEEGAYTGEISANMLKDLGCQYVLVGHSERRQLFGETNELVAKKFITAGKSGIKPILCVGESKEQRKKGDTEEIIRKQLACVLDQPESLSIMRHAVIAYEPVWAIGTGLTATPQQAQEVHSFIRSLLERYDGLLAQTVRILYGGSVKQSNAQELFKMPDIDGGLIGGASLDGQEFLGIIELCNNCL